MRVAIITLLLISAITHSKAQIVYTDVKPDSIISDNHSYNLDLNNDGITDFKIMVSASKETLPCGSNRSVNIISRNANELIESKLSPNSIIDKNNSFDTGKYTLRGYVWTYSSRNHTCAQNYSGKWVNGDGYIGLKLKKGGHVYYGWVRLDVSVTSSSAGFTIKDYAYNSNANQPILAGQKTNFNWSSVTTLSPSSAYCPGNTVNITYVTGGSFQASNIFTAQLSDSTGSFGKPVIIGSLQSRDSGTIQAVIPLKTSPGAQFRIRVVSSSPPDSSYDNGTDLIIGAGIFATGSTDLCRGLDGLLSLIAPKGYTYQWYKNGKLITNAKTYELQIDNLEDTAGSYKYKCIISGICGSYTSNTIITVVHSGLPVSLVASGPTTFCKGGNVTITDTAGKGSNYTWTRFYHDAEGYVYSDVIPRATYPYYTATKTGNYYINVTDEYGCVTTAGLPVDVPAIPETYIYISNNGDSSFCNGDSAYLVTGFNIFNTDYPLYKYQWKKNGKNISGATTNFYYAKTAGTYTCKVSDTCGSIITNALILTTKQCKGFASKSSNTKSVLQSDLNIAPNPFSNSTTISFTSSQSQKVSVTIYDMNGRLIKTLANEQMHQGSHQHTWNAKDKNGNAVTPGIYLLKLQAGSYMETKKIFLTK